MSQMLVRIDEETDKELAYIYKNNGMLSLNEVAVAMGIVRRRIEEIMQELAIDREKHGELIHEKVKASAEVIT